MMKVVRSLFPLLLLLMVGCGSSKPAMTFMPKLSVVDIPALGEVVAVELGETLVKKGLVYEYDAIDLHNTVTLNFARMGSYKATLNPSKLVAFKRQGNYVYYKSNNIILRGERTSGGLKINLNDPKDVRGFWDYALPMTPEPKAQPDPVISATKVIDLNSPNFMQELIYNGRIGNSLKFLYRESSYNTMRVPFNQEIQYDLADGTVIGFKGVRIEVLDATNTKIKYKVLSTFPDSM